MVVSIASPGNIPHDVQKRISVVSFLDKLIHFMGSVIYLIVLQWNSLITKSRCESIQVEFVSL